ncbi:hypothetical protein QBC34DRAFT_441675 [Podospora aff. communis PSN243]|uniref:C2H2-type domain-containing protein n=1 Tax=Podospora aff. communis PSN243 TaxID=3040156 RepID=A0AAV9GDP0_9PEZI|nr:hypothetical protein QBC34DRAFT_441675 [Podospora aff. communis PSN243]
MTITTAFDQTPCSPGKSPGFSGAGRDGGRWSPAPEIGSRWSPAAYFTSGIGACYPSSPSIPRAENASSCEKAHCLPSTSSPSLVKGARRSRGKVRHNVQSKMPTLACPFYRFDPHIHHNCQTFTLRRVKDIKQHIQRKHTAESGDAEFCCELCLSIFNPEERQHGTNNLPNQDESHPPWHAHLHQRVITSEQEEKLKNYLGRGKPIQEQWYDMWDILFPGWHRPRAIHLDSIHNSSETRMRMLRRVWETRRSEILSVACTSPTNVSGGLAQPGSGDTHDHLQWRGSTRAGWSSVPSMRPTIATATARIESSMQWRAIDQVMNTFLDLVKEEMTDDIADGQITYMDGSSPDGTVVEPSCQLPGVQQQRLTSVDVCCPEEMDPILWCDYRDLGTEYSGVDMAQETLAFASASLTCDFEPSMSGGSW